MGDRGKQVVQSLNRFSLLFILLGAVYVSLVSSPGGITRTWNEEGEEFACITQAISLANDGDLDLRNQGFPPRQFGRSIIPHSLGTSILMLPFYLLGTPVAQLLATLSHSAYNPFDPIFFSLLGAGMILYFFLAGAALLKTGEREWGPEPTLAAVVLIWWGTFLPFYAFRRPFLSHVPDVFLASLLVCFCLALPRKQVLRRRDIVLLGIISGGTLLVRWQNLNLFCLGMAMGTAQIFSGKPMRGRFPRISYLLLLGGTALSLLFLTQGLAWEYYQGRFLPPPGEWLSAPALIQGENYLPKARGLGENLQNLGHMLWGKDWGLAWSAFPFLAGLLGCLFFPPLEIIRGQGKCLLNRLFLFLVIAFPFAAVLSNREQGASLGYRHLSGIFPLAAAGLAGALAKFENNGGIRKLVWLGGSAAILLSLMIAVPFRRSPDTDLSPGWTPLGGYGSTNNHYLLQATKAWQMAFSGQGGEILSYGYLGWLRNDPGPAGITPEPEVEWLYPIAALILVGVAYLAIRRQVTKTAA